jgi:hypothetical protein
VHRSKPLLEPRSPLGSTKLQPPDFEWWPRPRFCDLGSPRNGFKLGHPLNNRPLHFNFLGWPQAHRYASRDDDSGVPARVQREILFPEPMKPDRNQKVTAYPRIPQFPPHPHPQRALFDAPPGRSLNPVRVVKRPTPTMASFPMQKRAVKGFPQFSTAVCPVSTCLRGDMHLNY